MKDMPVIRILITSVIYLLTYVILSSCGMIHPACYAYAGTVAPVLYAFIYLYTASKVPGFGAAMILNGFVLVVGSLLGETNLSFAVILTGITLLAELLRKQNGYDTLKGVRLSFVPFAYSFYAYTSHWWTDTARSLAEAVEVMPAGYRDRMEPVIHNIPALIAMLVLTVPVAVLGMRLAERVMKRETGTFR